VSEPRNRLYRYSLWRRKPLNAAVVKASLERLMDPKLAAPNRTLLGTVTAIDAPQDLQVQITTKEPFAPLLENLAHPGAAIVPPGFDQTKRRGIRSSTGRCRRQPHAQLHSVRARRRSLTVSTRKRLLS
jgi:MarR-like DNA-binding transcriptional regulator SgrR of sgrS sRNA